MQAPTISASLLAFYLSLDIPRDVDINTSSMISIASMMGAAAFERIARLSLGIYGNVWTATTCKGVPVANVVAHTYVDTDVDTGSDTDTETGTGTGTGTGR